MPDYRAPGAWAATAVNADVQHDLDEKGIAKTAREEKRRQRDAKLKQAEDERMMKLYREHVLGEKPIEGLVTIDSILPAAGAAPAKAKTEDAREEVGSFGD